jgi:hypothetical protein
MLENFDAVKGQLKELAEVVNAFKSEAVQLRVVDLLFGASQREGEETETPTPAAESGGRRRAARRRSPEKAENANGSGGERKGGRAGGRPGARATLSKLHADGFFKKPHTLGALVKHAETNLALKYNQSDFSGSLARYVRDGKLKRTKNSENQYEYVQP